MSSANNLIGSVSAYASKSAAAVNASGVANKSSKNSKATNGFDSILNKVTDNLSRSSSASQQSKAKQPVKELKSNPYKTDRNVRADKNSEITDEDNRNVDRNNEAGRTSGDLLSQIAAFLSQNGNAAGEVLEGIDANAISKEDLLSLLGGQLSDVTADIRELLQTDFGSISQELNQAIVGSGIQLFNNVANELDLPAEDIMNAMQTLGLMAMDLLNPQNMQQLVTKLSGGEQGIDLITDSDIYTSLQDLMEGAESMNSELMNEFDLSEDGLQSAISDSKEQFANMMQQNMADGSQEQDPTELSLEEMIKARQDRLSRRQDSLREYLSSREAPGSEAFSELTSKDEVKDALSRALLKDDNPNSFNNGAESSNLFNQLMNRIADAAGDVQDSGQVSYTDRAQMQDIIRQITDRISISAGPEETSMELALHPASLGNVNILLTSGKDGIVAKFTAQNQIVKEAVETQMLQLQQKFDEQGIKITSIEVTIASHGFEQNLDQEGKRGQENTGDGKRVRPLRRINLSEIDDEIAMEMNSDAEKIAMQMMAANGNSVDFSA